MDRKEFLALIGVGTAALACGAAFGGCGQVNDVPTPPSNVNITLDLSKPAYSSLNNVGGSVYIDNNQLIVACTGENAGVKTYTALSSACPHAGTNVVYQGGSNPFHCNSHGSNFRTNGTVINGPASSPLKQYKTSLNGTLLRVYS